MSLPEGGKHFSADEMMMLLGALGGLETAMTVLGMSHGDGLPAAVASLADPAP